jgi:hypothetical protein
MRDLFTSRGASSELIQDHYPILPFSDPFLAAMRETSGRHVG